MGRLCEDAGGNPWEKSVSRQSLVANAFRSGFVFHALSLNLFSPFAPETASDKAHLGENLSG